jgi:hypothetical protein
VLVQVADITINRRFCATVKVQAADGVSGSRSFYACLLENVNMPFQHDARVERICYLKQAAYFEKSGSSL